MAAPHVGYTWEQWLACVRANVRLRHPNDAQDIAQLCMDADKAGKPFGVWHGGAVFYGFLNTCPCVPCTQKRKAA